MEIRRRQHHRNCKCALQKLLDICSDDCPQQRKIPFPKKQAESDHSLSIGTSRLSSPSYTNDDSSIHNIGSLFSESASDTTNNN
ncbi:hypothetical protein SADUNF_Sadunf18G0092400 [Salix dunnii]|uniref:Uncharacterized protein n=1 Tax=Salix dunnii TaxID=1413687 RepID=A0A835J6T8_9ROSI|nr:hypothetical protein SADUNF_Sadunf18G0092400 [Salix dunnii]